MKRIPSAVRAAIAVVALTGALAATAHTSVWVPARVGVADPVALLSIVATAFAGCLAPAALISFVGRVNPRRALAATLPGAVVAAVLLSLFFISRTDLHLELIAGTERDGPTTEGVRLESDWRGPAQRNGGREDEVGVRVQSSDLAALLRRLVAVSGLLGLVALVALRMRSRRSMSAAGHGPLGTFERAAAHGVIVQTIEAMLADHDPRTAIIGAYARLLEELDANGASRHPYEGPGEHLTRVLGLLDVRPSALRTLVRLFEIARFSEHALSATHRDEALGALREVAEDLAAPASAADRVTR